MPDTSNIVTAISLNTKIGDVKNKTPDTSNVVTVYCS